MFYHQITRQSLIQNEDIYVKRSYFVLFSSTEKRFVVVVVVLLLFCLCVFVCCCFSKRCVLFHQITRQSLIQNEDIYVKRSYFVLFCPTEKRFVVVVVVVVLLLFCLCVCLFVCLFVVVVFPNVVCFFIRSHVKV